MPSYGSLHSPSLRKMNGKLDSGRRSAVDMGNIIGDPFALATISIAMLAWVIAFISSIVAAAQAAHRSAAPGATQEAFPNFSWWTIVYMLFCIIGVFFVTASDTAHTYHVAIVGFLAAGLIMTTSSVNTLVYSSRGAEEAAAAGHILLSMIAIVWIFYFGSTPSAVSRAYLDSFALHKSHRHSGTARGMSTHYNQRPETSASIQNAPQVYAQTNNNTFNNNSQMTSFPQSAPRMSQPAFGTGNISPMPNQNTMGGPTMGSTIADTTAGEVTQPTEYPYRAKAIYSYEANPDDVNEISFSKHEILEVSDVSGRWWQAKKENGETGIAPSNYLILL